VLIKVFLFLLRNKNDAREVVHVVAVFTNDRVGLLALHGQHQEQCGCLQEAVLHHEVGVALAHQLLAHCEKLLLQVVIWDV